MPTVFLAVGRNFSASGIVSQGTIDSTSGPTTGTAIPCPGVFPCRIACKSRTSGSSSVELDQVYAGPNHVLIREFLHDYVPYAGSRVRLESKSRNVKLAGGIYTEPLTSTLDPVLAPYVSSIGWSAISSLRGLPDQVFTSTSGYPSYNLYLYGLDGGITPSDPANYHSAIDSFEYTFNRGILRDGAHLLWSQSLSNNPVSVNLSGFNSSDVYTYLTDGTTRKPNYPVQVQNFPVTVSPGAYPGVNIIDAGSNGSDLPATRRSASSFMASGNALRFGCFALDGTQSNTLFGTALTSDNFKELAIYGSETAQGYYTLAGIKASDSTPFLAFFSSGGTSEPTAEFFQMYRPNTRASGLKPSFGFDSSFVSVNSGYNSQTLTNYYWSSAYPTGKRFSKYSDVKSTQYGFVFLNQDTKHLEFMFQPHVDPWFIGVDLQTVNKLLHAPPRSADHYPALNMLWGVDPLNPTTAASLYAATGANAATVKTFFNEHITHGGGGHVMALGTYNGAVVNNGVVTVWGSNRWGQCVMPDVLKSVKVIDVAASIAPPVLDGLDTNSVYSEDLAEAAARDYSSPDSWDSSTGANPYKYSYPPDPSVRFGRHINYTNLPGHVVVVTDTGRVYAWGNNKYYQCEVPNEIALVSDTGAVVTTAPTDPISEVAAGAFHTVARSKSGALYVWGAGGPWVNATYGRYVPVATGDERPATSSNPTYYKSVHFGQSSLYIGGSQNISYSLAAPVAAMPGISGNTNEALLTTSYVSYAAGSVTTLARTVAGTSVNIGQKTAAGFCPSDPSGGRLKGMIAAGAFHTAVIDSALKIQCVGAGRGVNSNGTIDIVANGTFNDFGGVQPAYWGCSYGTETDMFATYPHYCQGMSQYRCPANVGAGSTLFRFSTTTLTPHKSRYFQDLLFKKVTCGPFSTHGIVYSVARSTPDVYSDVDKAYLHNRVVSWGCVHSPRAKQVSGTGSTGILNLVQGSTQGFGAADAATVNGQAVYNPAGTICGAGSVKSITSNTPRMFEVLNRTLGSNSGMYSSYLSLVGAPSPNAGTGTSVGTVSASSNQATEGNPNYATGCPVTISRFKVKDAASCGDFAIYIGYVNNLSQSSLKVDPQDVSPDAVDSGASYDYEASVMFTGADYYRDVDYASYEIFGRLHANNPYAGANLVRRNKIGNTDLVYSYLGSSGLKVKNRSMYFGSIISPASGVVGRLPSDTTDRPINYVVPTTALASANMVAAVVNMDNRPVAWSGFFKVGTTYTAPLDLSLLPSVPLSSFKTGKSHIMAVTAGDWPVAISLGVAANAPKIVSELGNRLFTSTVPTAQTAPALLVGDAVNYLRPVLLAWGAGDGREFGTTLLAFGKGSGGESTYGMWFLDTHAVSRYDATYAATGVNPLAAGTDAWENFYGQYRWNLYSKYDDQYVLPTTTSGGGLGSNNGSFSQPTAGAISLPAGHHAVDAMQSMLAFRQDQYPTSFVNPALGSRNLLNGTQLAAIPSGALMPFVASASQTGSKARCCATAADEAPTHGSLNSLQEYHSPLGYMQQTYTDYVTDYSAGSLHSAVLFSSSCPNWANISNGTFKSSFGNFLLYFMSNGSGAIHFGERRICKLGLVGYGCENQTAASERLLGDGSLAPLVPMLFSRSAKVYCGDSYTLVTDPVRIVTATSGPVNVTLPNSGGLFTYNTLPITIPAASYSRRIRGLDVKLKFTATSAATPIPLSSWSVTIPYKLNTWTVLDRVKANVDFLPAVAPSTAFVPAGTATTTYRVSDRFGSKSSYTYRPSGSTELYSEQGLNPTNSGSYTFSSPNYYLNGINESATVPALSKQGCYYPVSVDPSTSAVTEQQWSMRSADGVIYPFDEPTINVVIKDYSSAASYANYTLEVILEIEVDAGELPYVLFGPNRSGVFNEMPGSGPSYVADIGSFSQGVNNGVYPTVEVLSCPCEIDSSLLDRLYPKGFPADSRFICGTKKYGPSGNRELQAAHAAEEYYNPSTGALVRKALLAGNNITANFFNIFDTIPHRALISMGDQLAIKNPKMHVLPAGAFISTSGDVLMSVSAPAGSSSVGLSSGTVMGVYRGLGTVSAPSTSAFQLLTNSSILYNKPLFAATTPCVSSVASSNLSEWVGMFSNC